LKGYGSSRGILVWVDTINKADAATLIDNLCVSGHQPHYGRLLTVFPR
jgi:hypothetical protein